MLQFESPIWVRYKKGKYVVRPLFLNEPVVSDKRYEDALRKYVNTVRKQFSGEALNDAKRQDLLWYQFLPDYTLENLQLEFPYGKRYFMGGLSVCRFKHKGYTYICIPSLDTYFFISRHENPNRSQLVDEVIEHMQRWPRKQKSEHKESIQLEQYAAEKREFCTNIELNLYVRQERIRLGSDEVDIFRQLFRQSTEFDGAFEIRKVGQDLNDMYPNELEQAYFMDETVSLVKSLIYSRDRVPVVILGSRKIGKTSILHEAIRRYHEENKLKSYPILDNVWHIDPSRVIAGMSVVGMWQRRFEAIAQFAKQPNEEYKKRQDKLYFSNLIALFRIGKSAQNNMTLSDVLKPHLQDRDLQIIIEATPEAWDIASELDRSFTDLFKVIRIHEPNRLDTLRILARKRVSLEKQYDFEINNVALKSLVELNRRFFRKETLVGRVSDSLHQLASKYNRNISTEDVVKEFGIQTHLHPRISDTSQILNSDVFSNYFDERIIGQSDAIQAMSQLLSSLKAQLNDPEKPFGSFLFIGPTGVGKTHAAKVLADYLFTHEDRLVRFDMNEFIDPYAVNRLVGDFSQPEGQLTSKIRYNPYCVLLFDEIEKAHPDVHNLLLQVLGEGRLTDALGRTVNFCNTVIIMTSNLGAQRVRQEINLLGREDLASSTYQKAVMDFFRPEFINRIDQVVIFHRLEAKHIAEIAWLQIHNLLRRHGFVRRHTILNITKAALERIAARGFDPEFGGRALKRQIEKDMTLLLAEQLVETPPQNPVIFNLVLHGQRLVPHLVSLEHVEAAEWSLPDFSGREIAVSDFEEMLERVQWVKRSLDTLEEDEDEDGAILEFVQGDPEVESMLSLKERIFELEEKLQTIIWDYQTRKRINLSGSNWRTKSFAIGLQKIDHNDKHYLREIYSQMQVQDYLNDLIAASDRIVEESNSLYFELHHNISWLEYLASKHINQGVERVLIRLKPLISKNRISQAEEVFLHFLATMFQEIQGGEIISVKNVDELFLAMEGPGLMDLFQQEVGVHLLLMSHQTLFPVELTLQKIPPLLRPQDFAQQLITADPKPIDPLEKHVKYSIRLYSFEDQNWKHLWHANRKKKQLLRTHVKGTLTDLRTGMVNQANLRKREVQLLFWGSLTSNKA